MTYIGSKLNPYQSTTFGTSLSLKVDGGFNSVTINPSGRDVVLAGRKGLYLIDLDDPFQPPRWLHHITPWEVADVQWYPHPAKPYWVVSTSNQKAIIWNLTKSSTNAIEYALHGHHRAITDINFNPEHPDILATCSIDTYVHAWDLRSPTRPFYSTSAWKSAASQVKWNYKDPNILASSHGNDVFIWDLRNRSTPLYILSGHESSVNSIDFNRFRKNEIMSSSNDGTVKFWDITNTDKCKRTITTDFPIWRGRYLPFGKGYCVMPMIGGNNSVYMMNLEDDEYTNDTDKNVVKKFQPVKTFKGHNERVVDFLWRQRYPHDTEVDNREFQLVTWSKDSNLKLWPMTDEIYDKVNFERNRRLEEKLPNYEYVSFNKFIDKSSSNDLNNKNNDNCTQTNDDIKSNNANKDCFRIKETFVTTSALINNNDVNHLNWLSGVRMNYDGSTEDLFEDTKLQNLGEEVSSIGHKFPKIIFEKISVSTGELILTLNGPWSDVDPDEYIFLRIEVKFPKLYPQRSKFPVFTIEENKNLVKEKKQEILKMLDEISRTYTDVNQYCLEPCLRYLLGEKIDLDEVNNIDNEPLLNFDIAAHIGFDNFSSISDAEPNDEMDVSSDSDSESDLLKEQFDEQSDSKNTFGRNLAFDSTPVPNECGATWTPSGKLLCFFTSENKSDKINYNNLKLTQKALQKKQSSGSYEPQELFDEMKSNPSTSLRPKRYVDTFSNHGNNSSDESDVSSQSDTGSDSSYDSFEDDWKDIIGNDIVVRTKLPAVYDKFTKGFGSIPSESVKTDPTRRKKNVIFDIDFSNLIPEKRFLASEYQIMEGLPGEMARNNALVAEKYGLDDISHCWQILSDLLFGGKDNEPFSSIWEIHYRGLEWFVKESLQYFIKQNNSQMLAMICCVLSQKVNMFDGYDEGLTDNLKFIESVVTFNNGGSGSNGNATDINSHTFDLHSSNSSSRSSNYQTRLLFKETTFDSGSKNRLPHSDGMSDKATSYFTLPSQLSNQITNKRLIRNNLQNNNFPGNTNTTLSNTVNSQFRTPLVNHAVTSSDIPTIKVALFEDDLKLTSPNYQHRIFNNEEMLDIKRYIYQYAKLLLRWGLSIERTKILKVDLNEIALNPISESAENNNHEMNIHTHSDDINTGIATCWLDNADNDITFYNCNYCQLRVQGDAFICGNCQHVLHMQCAGEWWKVSEECPSGCGCHCPSLFDIQ